MSQAIAASAGTDTNRPDQARSSAYQLNAVYAELRRIANWYVRASPLDFSVSPTDIVHESVLRVLGQRNQTFNDETHALAIGALMIRRVLRNYLRDRHTRQLAIALFKKHRSGADHGNTAMDPSGMLGGIDFIDLDEALTKLERRSPIQARVVELRFFGQMTYSDIAMLLGISARKAQFDWNHAKLWLARELEDVVPR